MTITVMFAWSWLFTFLISSTFISWNSLRKSCPFFPIYLFMQLKIYISMESWMFILFYGLLHSPYLFLILFQFWPMGLPSGWWCVLSRAPFFSEPSHKVIFGNRGDHPGVSPIIHWGEGPRRQAAVRGGWIEKPGLLNACPALCQGTCCLSALHSLCLPRNSCNPRHPSHFWFPGLSLSLGGWEPWLSLHLRLTAPGAKCHEGLASGGSLRLNQLLASSQSFGKVNL